jgi:hypothetical protein
MDALDESRSTIVRFPSSGRIMAIERAAFDTSRLNGIRFFKVPQYLRGSLWVTDDVANSVRAAGLTGTGFRLASHLEYGPVA